MKSPSHLNVHSLPCTITAAPPVNFHPTTWVHRIQALQMLPNLFLFLFLFLLPSLCTASCHRHCGNLTVPYPFGFTDACPIKLDCRRGRAQLRSFAILSISNDTFLVDVPPTCDLPIDDLRKLFGANYAVTSRNALLVSNCSTHRGSNCAIPAAVLREGAGAPNCDAELENITCFYNGTSREDGFLRMENLLGSGCSLLYSSMAYLNATPQGRSQQVLSFEFQTLELGWWVEGACQDWCLQDAMCRNFSSPVTKLPSLTCSCQDGFVGDGFKNGSGCRKEVSRSCNAAKFFSGDCGGRARIGVLIGGIAAGAVLMALVVTACYYIRKRTAFLRVRKSTKRLLSEASCSVPLYPYKDIERATNNFSDGNQLGTGAYGTVYFGTIHSGERVAIKKLRNKDNNSIEQLLNEIKLLSSVSHPNLVRILGCCIEKDEQILVYEYMPNGTLSQHLQRERGQGLPWTIRLNIATETARAIAHLHFAERPPIYHRDIKSSNILLDHNFNSKLADFGLSKMILTESSHISTAPQGTPGYLDPQYHQNFHLSNKSDVYSFGVVLVEIITALKVVDFNRGQSEVNLAALAVNKIGRGQVEEIIDQSLEPHRDAWKLSSIHKVAELAFRCLAFHRDMRPSMMEVVDELEQIRISGWVPSEENVLFSRQSSACSSVSHGAEKTQILLKSRRLDYLNVQEERRGDSPVSMEDPWFSEQSSPSENSLLGHAAR